MPENKSNKGNATNRKESGLHCFHKADMNNSGHPKYELRVTRLCKIQPGKKAGFECDRFSDGDMVHTKKK